MKKIKTVALVCMGLSAFAGEYKGIQVYVRNLSGKPVEIVPEKKGAKSCDGQSIINGKSYTLQPGEIEVFYSGQLKMAGGRGVDCALNAFAIPKRGISIAMASDIATGKGYLIEVTDSGIVQRPWFKVPYKGQVVLSPGNDNEAKRWKNIKHVPAIGKQGMTVQVVNLSGEPIKVMPEKRDVVCEEQGFVSGKPYTIDPYTQMDFRAGKTLMGHLQTETTCSLHNFNIMDGRGYSIAEIDLAREFNFISGAKNNFFNFRVEVVKAEKGRKWAIMVSHYE